MINEKSKRRGRSLGFLGFECQFLEWVLPHVPVCRLGSETGVPFATLAHEPGLQWP